MIEERTSRYEETQRFGRRRAPIGSITIIWKKLPPRAMAIVNTASHKQLDSGVPSCRCYREGGTSVRGLQERRQIAHRADHLIWSLGSRPPRWRARALERAAARARLLGLPLQAKTPPGRTTYRSCSKRCADGGGQLCAYALISPCAPGCSVPPPRLVAEDGMREEGRGDRTALIRPLALSSVG